MLHIKNLFYKVGNFELNVPDLQIPTEGISVIQGPSGSGKTTFLKMLIGLLNPNGWSCTLNGESFATLPVQDRRIGVVFQSYDLFPHLTAEENIKVVMKARKKYSQISEDEALQTLVRYKQMLKLDKCWHTSAEKLSGGERQRVALLRALMSNPKILLLDEPFSALDESLRGEARDLLKSVVQNLRIPIILITHDSADVKALAERTFIIDHGKIN